MSEENPQDDSNSYDLLPEILEEILSFSFPVLTQPSQFQKDKRLVGPSPFMFYDRHVNEGQRLKRVASVPALADDLRKCVDDRLFELRQREGGLLPVRIETMGKLRSILPLHLRPPLEAEITPDTVINRLGLTISASCLPLASFFVLHPRAPIYDSVLSFNQKKRIDLPPVLQGDPREDFTFRFLPPEDIQPDTLCSIDESVKGALKDWHDRDLVTWILLPVSPDSENLLQSLDELFTVSDIPSPICTVHGYPGVIDKTPATCDAEIAPWILPVIEPVRVAETPDDLSLHQPSGSSAKECSSVIYPRMLSSDNLSLSTFEEMREPTPEGLVHHVWRLAIQQDTTVIVVNCGNYERIGVRHRGTRTLYFSDTIDVTKPGYGKLHLGLTMSILVDALNRYQVHCAQHPKPVAVERPFKRARKAPVTGNPGLRRSKRQEVNALLHKFRDRYPLDRSNNQLLWREVDQRPLLLLRFSGGSLNSSRPTCCLRKGGTLSRFTSGLDQYLAESLKESYHPKEYFLLTLAWESFCGATGQVFIGSLQVTLSGGKTLRRDVVAKVAYYAKARERVRREFKVYQHLWAHGIKRIPEVYGIFEDMDDLATVLVMERAACTFRQREPHTQGNKGGLKEVPPTERLEVMRVVKAIHKAGVIHGDLRPENIVLAQDGKPMVIDFDRAKFDPTDNLKEAETTRLNNLLSGRTTALGHPIPQ